MKNNIKLFSVLVVGLLLATACTKPRGKRDGQFADPMVAGNAISMYDEVSFTLTTGKSRYNVSRSSAESFVNESQKEGFIDLPVVEYTVNYPKNMPNLLGEDLRFRGIPGGHKYEIQTKFENDKLWVGKVGTISEIPTDEITIAEKISDEKYFVPLLSYSVTFYKRELTVNADNEDSNIYGYRQLKPTDKGSATHIRINELTGQLTAPLLKTDTFKKDYFDGEWFYAETIVEAKHDSTYKGLLGTTEAGQDNNLRSATRIKFVHSASSMQVVNVNVDPRLLERVIESNTDLEFDQVMTIPSELVDYRRVENDKGIFTGSEESYKDKNFREREWIRLSLNDATSSVYNISALFQGTRILTDLRISDEFWSFTLLDKGSGAKVRYSFYRVENALSDNYEPRNYILDDAKYFGVFPTVKAYIDNYEIYAETDMEKYIFLNRFNPKNKVIEFHMSHEMAQYPISVKLAEEALKYWSIAFQKAGTGITVRLNKKKTVDLGDLRYNVLHIVDRISSGEIGRGLLFGRGPSISDPNTGEIISVSNTLHVDSFRAVAVGKIRTYLMWKSGTNAKVVNEIRQNFSPLEGDTVNSVASVGSSLGLSMNQVDSENSTHGETKFVPLQIATNSRLNPSGFEFTDIEFNREAESKGVLEYFDRKMGFKIETNEDYIEAMKLHGENLFRFGLVNANRVQYGEDTSKNSFDQIESKCPEIKDFSESDKFSLTDSSVANPIVLACANKILPELALSTLVHELGHNFGLAHNFSASNDEKNFWTKEEVKETYGLDLDERHLSEDALKTASIMEYMPSNRDENIVPGQYDIAALRYSYTGYVEGINGGLKKIENTKTSLEENFGRNLKDQINVYHYCSDYEALVTQNDPLCLRHDFGANADEVVDYMINSYYDSISTGTYRYGRKGLNSGSNKALGRLATYVMPMKRIYDEWRFKLADFMGDNNLYLKNTSAAKYLEILNDMKNSDSSAEDFMTWRSPAQKAMNFLVQMSLLPNHYCVGITANKNILPVELDVLIEKIKRTSPNGVVVNCESELVVEKLKESYNADYAFEMGFSPDDRRYSLRTVDLEDPLDYSGVRADRINATAAMSMRLPMSYSHLDRNFFPNMIDEPDFRNAVSQMIVGRAAIGVDLTSQYMNRIQQLTISRMNSTQRKTFEGLPEEKRAEAILGSGLLNENEQKATEIILEQLEGMITAIKNRQLSPAQAGFKYQKFDREEAIINQQYNQLLRGLGVPNETLESQNRIAPYTSVVSVSPDYVNQPGIVKVQLPDGKFITAIEEKNTINAQLIKVFSQTGESLQLSNFADSDFAEAKQVLESMGSLLPAGDKAAFTVLNLRELMADEGGGLSEQMLNQSIGGPAKVILQTVFANEIALVQGQIAPMVKKLTAAAEQSEEAKNDLDQLMSLDLKESYNNSPIPTLANLSAKLNVMQAKSRFAAANKDELEAKQDLLLKIIAN